MWWWWRRARGQVTPTRPPYHQLIRSMKTKQTILAVGAAAVALLHLNAALAPVTSESRSYSVEREDGTVRVVNTDGSSLSDEDVEWLNSASSTNVGTAVGLMQFEVVGIVIRKDYNSFGFEADGDVTLITK